VIRAAAVAVIALGVLSGCSQPLTVDAYVAEASRAADAYVTESQNLSYDYQSTLEDDVRRIAEEGGEGAIEEATNLVSRETIAYLAVLSDAMRRYADDLDDLDAPSAVADAHDAHVAAVEAVLFAIPATRDAVESAGDIAGIQLALTSSGFADGQARWTITCSALEQAVRDQGTGLDLRCTRQDRQP